MATVINNPGSDSSSGANWVIAVALIVVVVLALLFAVPALRNVFGSAPAVSVPDSIDLNVNGGGGQ